MTESFIMVALGIGLGYSIKLWLPRVSATLAPANGPIKGMQSVAYQGATMDASGTASVIGNLLREAGAITVMFVDSKGELIVVDAETGKKLPDFVDKEHPHHSAEIKLNKQGEPKLLDKRTGQPMAKPRLLCSRSIHFWRYQGSTCECIWSNGKHIVIRR